MTLLYAEDLTPGEIHELGTTKVSEAEIIEFAQRFDPLPIHVDPVAAAAGPFGGIIASATHSLALFSALASTVLMPRLALVAGKGIEKMRLPNPLRPDVVVTATMQIREVVPRFRDGVAATADVHCTAVMVDPDGRPVLTFDAIQVVRFREPQ